MTIMTMTRDVHWSELAACVGTDPEVFSRYTKRDVERAKRICAPCPVRAECRQYADDTEDGYSILGGETARERTGRKLGRAPADIPLAARRERHAEILAAKIAEPDATRAQLAARFGVGITTVAKVLRAS